MATRRCTILWDNDGVLVDTERLYYQATRQIFEEHGVALSEEDFIEHFMRRATGAWHLIPGIGEADVLAFRHRRNALYAGLLAFEDFRVDGAEETLSTLHGQWRMAVVTSSRREHFEVMHDRTGFHRFFDFVVTSDDVAATKPDPEPYLSAMAKGGWQPEQCIVIEDSRRGLAAAKAAGLECWVIPGTMTADEDFRGADRVLGGIGELPALLDAVA